jgi:hypothetical protein
MTLRARGKRKTAIVRGNATAVLLMTVMLGGVAGARAATDSTGPSHPGGAAAAPATADVLPFFKPDPAPVMYGPALPDPDVSECAGSDRACLEAHDAAALSAALADENDACCDDSRHPDACRAAYEMITGNVGMKADPILDDPCSWVVLVDHGIATIESKRTGVLRRYADRGWKPRTFLGKCDLSRLSSLGNAEVVPLPSWVAPRPEAVPSSGLTTTMTARRTKAETKAETTKAETTKAETGAAPIVVGRPGPGRRGLDATAPVAATRP